MSGPSPPFNDLNTALQVLLNSNADPETFAKRLFEIDYLQAQTTNLNLAEMMRACAIPHFFDVGTIGVLRNTPEETEVNTDLFDKLLSYNFVLARQNGGYTYHDNIRQMLLADWQQVDKLSTFDTYKKRLVPFYIFKGKKAYKDENYSTALTNFNQAIELEPENGELYHWRGKAQLKITKPSTARIDLRKAIEFGFATYDTYHSLSLADYYLNDAQSAITNITRAIEQAPNSNRVSSALLALRGIYYKELLGQVERGIEDYTEAIELNPEAAYLFKYRAKAYIQLKQFDLALNDLSAAIWLDPKNDEAFYERGKIHYDKGSKRAAYKDFSSAIELNRQDAYAYYIRGKIHSERKKYDLAIDDYSKAIELNPQYIDAFYERAFAYREVGKFEEALEDFNVVIKLNPQHIEAFYSRAGTYHKMGQYEQALQDLGQAIKLNPQYIEAFYLRGITYHKMGQYEQALQDYNQTVHLDQASVGGYPIMIGYNIVGVYGIMGVYNSRANTHYAMGNTKLGMQDNWHGMKTGFRDFIVYSIDTVVNVGYLLISLLKYLFWTCLRYLVDVFYVIRGAIIIFREEFKDNDQ